MESEVNTKVLSNCKFSVCEVTGNNAGRAFMTLLNVDQI